MITFDPASALSTGEITENGLPAEVMSRIGRDRDPRARLQHVRGAREVGPAARTSAPPRSPRSSSSPPARPSPAPLIAAACDLTEREREVAQLVASGLATSAIAAEPYLSTWTVQDHLKAIFAKVGSRGEFVARLFLEPGPPRLS